MGGLPSGQAGGGEAGYHAVQRLDRVLPDPTDATHSYAMLDRATELGVERLVPRFRLDDTPFEIGLPRARGSNTASVRLISDADFVAIVTEGLREAAVPDALPRTGPLQDFPTGMSDAAEPFVPRFGAIRPQVLMSRALRDRAFARQVKRA